MKAKTGAAIEVATIIATAIVIIVGIVAMVLTSDSGRNLCPCAEERP